MIHLKGKQNENGITLVALVITVIVLLILAGVAISLIFGEDGLFGRANVARNKFNDAAQKEADLINKLISGKFILTDDDTIVLEENEQVEEIQLPIAQSEYNWKGNIKYYSPDLTGFNAKQTYFITYDDDGTEHLAGRADKSAGPENWYDYENKKWANIVTVNNGIISYWVWIPRYMYYADGSANPKEVKAYFVDYLHYFNNLFKTTSLRYVFETFQIKY